MDRVYLCEAAERRWATRFILKAEEKGAGGAGIMESNGGALGLVSSTSGRRKIEVLHNLSCITA